MKEHYYGENMLQEAIDNIKSLRKELLAQESLQEAELLYQLTSLVMEINQYLGGGYLSPEFIKEKCDKITFMSQDIHKEVFN